MRYRALECLAQGRDPPTAFDRLCLNNRRRKGYVMPTMDDIANKYPWVIIDISSLLGDPTPSDMKELSEHKNSLWRQFYIDWLIQNRHVTHPKDVLIKRMARLNEVTRTRPDKKPYQADVDFFKSLGRLQPGDNPETFHFAMREIKDTVHQEVKKAKEEGGKLTEREAGLRLAATVIEQSQDYTDLSAANILITASLQMLSNDVKTVQGNAFVTLTQEIEATTEKMAAAYRASGAEVKDFPKDKAKDVLWQTWKAVLEFEAALRKSLEVYKVAVPYIDADEKGRRQLRVIAEKDEHQKSIYDAADKGEITRRLLEILAEYAQAQLSFGLQIGYYTQTYVDWVKIVIARELRKGFTQEFPDAALGLLIAKTAVGVTSSAIGFAPPPYNVIGSGLTAVMSAIETATREILLWQAKNDPQRVIELYGKTYHEKSEASPQATAKKLVDGTVEFGLPELMNMGADVGHKAADLVNTVKDLHLESGLTTAGHVIPGVGAAITIGVLAYEWNEWNEARQKEAVTVTGLQPGDLAKLSKDLEDRWQQIHPTEQAYAVRAIIGQDKGEYIEVTVDGEPGKWYKKSMRFESNNPTSLMNTRLQRAKAVANGKTFPYKGRRLAITNWNAGSAKWKDDGSLVAGVDLTTDSHTFKGQAAIVPTVAGTSNFPYDIEIVSVQVPSDAEAIQATTDTFDAEHLSRNGKTYTLDFNTMKKTKDSDIWNLKYSLYGETDDHRQDPFDVTFHWAEDRVSLNLAALGPGPTEDEEDNLPVTQAEGKKITTLAYKPSGRPTKSYRKTL